MIAMAIRVVLALRASIFLVATLGTIQQACAQSPSEAPEKAIERYLIAGDVASAAAVAEGLLRDRQKRLGPDDPETGFALNALGAVRLEQGRYREAEHLLGRAVAIQTKTSGEDVELAKLLANLGRARQELSQFEAAEELFKRAFAIYAEGLIEPWSVGHTFTNLGGLYRQQGRYREAEEAHQKALAIYVSAERGGYGDRQLPWVPMSLNNLANVYMDLARYDEAESLLKQAVEALEKKFGADYLLLGQVLGALGELYREQGRYRDAEKQLNRALQLAEQGKSGLQLATALNNLATHYAVEGRSIEAESLYQRALTVLEKALGGVDHPALGDVLSNFIRLLQNQGRYQEAILFHRRVLRIMGVSIGTEHLQYANALNNLGQLALVAHVHDVAEGQFREALRISTNVLGSKNPQVASYIHNLALTLQHQRRYSEAEPLYRQAIEIWQKAYGPDHIRVADGLSGLASLLVAQRQYGKAKPLYDDALHITEAALGPDHPVVGESLYRLGDWYFRQSRWEDAVGLLRRATNVATRNEARGAESEQPSGSVSELTQQSNQFIALLRAADRLASGANVRDQLAGEMFERAQWIHASQAAKALAQMAARGAAGKPVLGELMRERQSLAGEWQKRNALRIAAFSQDAAKRNSKVEAANFARLTRIDVRMAEIDARLAAEFPAYATLARSVPLSIQEVQTYLGRDEALLHFVDTSEEVFVWAVTKSDVRWVRLDVDAVTLKREVTALRCGLDASLWDAEAANAPCRELTKQVPTRDKHGILYETLPFETERAYTLYNALFGKIEDLVGGKHLLVALSGSLAQLPLHVLVSEKPASGDFRSARWLLRSHAITVLPAVSSLKALRLVAKPSTATQRMIGFGNPLLQGDPKNPQDVQWAAQARAAQACKGLPTVRVASAHSARRNVRSVPMRGGHANLDDLNWQVPLPDTASELCTVATALSLVQDDIFLGARATEATVKRLSAEGRLANYRVVHFATHGVMARQLTGVSEPGLILTPPAKQTELDDDYLTASEISALRLDADWIVLSACNTAAAEDNASQALSGLARAFFFAGARALLVSHWAVESPTTVKLVTATISNLVDDRKAGRAEVLRRAMLRMVEQGELREAHPAFWAPFVVVGEGGAAR